jgi:D-alanyl-lipoteichoic acid acyltransferase DltB (MBOAT superfamily)
VSIASVEFLALLLAFTSAFSWLRGPQLRRAVLAACNVGWLALFLPSLESWLVLGIFLGSGFAVAQVLTARPSRLLFTLYLAVLVSAFVVLQRYEFVSWIGAGWLEPPFRIIGLSYMLFRQIHFIVDSMQGQIRGATLWSYLNYQLNLFGVLAGPIMRYPQFESYWLDPRRPEWDAHEARKAYLRILVGLAKIAGAAAACLAVYEHFSGRLVWADRTPLATSSPWVLLQFAVVFYAYPAYVYWNFSGYCDVVIAGASLIGMRMPENFDKPYLARNMIEFWTRWHRTLGFWIRDYLFTPAYKSIAERLPALAPGLAFLCYFLAFVVAGAWHGSTLNWLIFGALNGAGVAAAKVWENHLIRRRGRKGLRAYLADARIRRLAVAANFHFACATMLFVPEDLRRTFAILRAAWSAVAP